MDLLGAFNGVNAAVAPQYRRQGDFTIGVAHPIISITASVTAVGDSRKVILQDGEVTVFTYLPNKYISMMTEQAMAAINGGGYTLTYLGNVAGFGHKFQLATV